MGKRTYQVLPGARGGWKLRLFEDGEPMGGGEFDDDGCGDAFDAGSEWVGPAADLVAEEPVPVGASELALCLLAVRRLIARPQGRDELAGWMGCSVPTLKRRLDDVRGLGAHVESMKVGKRWVYHVANAHMLEPRLSRWIELELQRSLVEVTYER